MDDEKVAYKGYEKMVKAGIKNVCIHKGLFAPGIEKQYPNLRGFADVADVGQAAKDWPQLNFVIYHSAYRHVGGDPKQALAEFERTGRISWTSDLADIPAQYGVSNVYGDVGQLFATTLVAEPNVCAALMGTLIKGLGADHVCWGTDALWTGAPQWQIEGLRRLEIPEAMQKKFGYAPLGAADGPVKTRDLRRQQCAALRHPAEARDAGAQGRPLCADEGGIREGGAGAVEHALRLCGAERADGSRGVCVDSSFGERSASRIHAAVNASMDSGFVATRLGMTVLFLLRGIPVHGIDPQHRLRLFHRLDVEIDRDRLAVAAHQHAFQHLVAAGVDFLVRHVGRHEDEIAGAGLGGELQLLAPAHPRLALHDIDDAFEMAVMMRAGLGVGPDGHGARP